ncbi:MAG: flagellar biosynthesis regulator FlaF [Nitrospirales bacterium]|nr:flagellar biosynthesis regulator FlaF [Nitrospirales bacterium]
MYTNQLEAYRTVQKTTMSGRDVEASVLTKAAQMIKECQQNWDPQDREGKLDAALKYNQKIWSLFQAELSKPDHPLPQRLREDLLSLSLFIDKRTFDVMAFPSAEKLTILINININIAAGLREGPA